jgi:hypothetical protein
MWRPCPCVRRPTFVLQPSRGTCWLAKLRLVIFRSLFRLIHCTFRDPNKSFYIYFLRARVHSHLISYINVTHFALFFLTNGGMRCGSINCSKHRQTIRYINVFKVSFSQKYMWDICVKQCVFLSKYSLHYKYPMFRVYSTSSFVNFDQILGKSNNICNIKCMILESSQNIVSLYMHLIL